jgi:hypothetical protein
MPFKSRAQQAWAFATGQPWAKKWAKHTPNMKKLPKRKGKSRGKRNR